MKDEIVLRSIHMQVLNSVIARQDTTSKRDRSNLHDAGLFFGKPDKKYLLDDYVRFPTMEEVLREYVTEVSVRKDKRVFRLMALNSNTNSFFSENPLVLIDGVPIFDIDKVMSIDPEKIKALEVVTHKYFYGGQAFDGVLNCISYQSDLAGNKPELFGSMVQYEGFQVRREFFAPVFENSDTAPDTRSLLYWNSNVKTDSNGRNQIGFRTSDIIGKYKVVVQGLSIDGKMGSSSFTFEVEK